MRRRQRAFWTIAVPVAAMLTWNDRSVGAQQPTEQPMASRSGIELTSLDRTADPCNDFYQFACGGWLASHPPPADQPRYGRFEALQERNNAILHDILEEAAKPSSPAEMRQIGDYYSSCLDQSTIESKGTAPLKPELDRVAAIKSVADLPPVVGHLHTLGFNPFFGFGAAPDFKDATQYIATFGQGGLALPDRDYYLKDDENSAKLREAYAQHVGRMLQLAGEAPDRAAAGAKTVMQIETALAKNALDRVAARNPQNLYHKMSLDEARKLIPSFDLGPYLQAAELPAVQNTNVTEPAFMKGLDQVLSSTPIEDLKTYLRWNLIHGQTSVMPKAFDEETFAFYGKQLTGAQEQRPRWKRCVDATDGDLGEAVGKVYVERTFGPEGKERTCGWSRPSRRPSTPTSRTSPGCRTRRRSRRREAARVANKIGYPDRWRDYSSLQIVKGDAFGNSLRCSTVRATGVSSAKIGKPVDRTEWEMTPPTVNAYYNPLENNIVFPAGILQPPFFDQGRR